MPPEIATQRLFESPKSVGNSPSRRVARIIFVQSGTSTKRLVDVLLEPSLLLELGDEQNRFISAAGAELRDDIDQGPFDIFRHPLGITADIDVSAFSHPCPQITADLSHPILHIELLVAVARPRQGQAGQES